MTEDCAVAPEDLSGLDAGNDIPNEANRNYTVYGDSGRDHFDRSLGRVLVMMASDFGVNPGFYYYADDDKENSRASPGTRLEGTQGTVLFGRRLLSTLLAREDGDIAIAAICAHEFGHVYQYRSGLYDRITGSLPRYCKELHADFLAGWFLAKLKSRRPTIRYFEAGRYIESIGSTAFDSPTFHGTHNQRKTAIETGYQYSRDNPESTIEMSGEEGFEFIRSRYG